MRRMLIFRNIFRCPRTTLLLLGITSALWLSPIARAQSETLPDAGDSIRAFTSAAGWLEHFDVPASDTADAALPIENASGVCAVIRHGGRVLGIGADAAESEDLMVRRAVGRAMSQTLADPAMAGLSEAQRTFAGRHLLLQLDIAGALQPLPGRSFNAIAAQILPGIDGIAMRRGRGGNERWVHTFPAAMLAIGGADTPTLRLRGMATELDLPLDADLARLIDAHDVAVYSFRTLQLAQTRAGAFPVQTVRSEETVFTSDGSGAAVDTFTDDLIRHLLRHRQAPMVAGEDIVGHRDPTLDADRAGLFGTYHVVTDRFDPATPVDEAALLAAMTIWINAAPVDHPQRSSVESAIQQLLRAAMNDERPQPSRADAMRVFSLAGYEEDGSEGVGNGAAARLAQADHAAWSPIDTAMAAAAGARALREQVELAGIDATLVRGWLDRAWAETPGHAHVGLMPWAAWAEIDLAQATGEPLAHATELRAMRDMVVASQATIETHPDQPDVEGGFALQRGGRVMVTSHTLRPLAALIAMQSVQESTTDAEREQCKAVITQAMRYVMQLQVSPDEGWRYPSRAVGGLCDTTWSGEMPVGLQMLGVWVGMEGADGS